MIVTFTNCKGKAKTVEGTTTQTEGNTLGKAKYLATCASCHGEMGLADSATGKAMKARNFAKDAFKAGKDLKSVIKTVGNGLPGTAMIGYKAQLNEKEIKAVSEYVIELSNKR